MIGALGTQPNARAIVEPQPATWLLSLRNFQPFAPPDALYPIVANPPSRTLQQHRNATIAIAAILAGQPDDCLGQRIFVVSLCRPVALRATWLVHQVARSSLADSMHAAGMADRTTPSLRA